LLSQRLQRYFLLIFIIYLTFIGGTLYSGNSLVLKMILQGSVTLILGLWLARLLYQRRAFPPTSLNAPLAVYVVWLLVTSLLSENVRISLEGSWRFIIHVGGFFLMVAIIRAGRQRWLFEALGLTGGLIVLLSLIEIGGSYFRLEFLELFSQSGDYVLSIESPIDITVYRLSLAMNVSTTLASYVALILPVLFVWALTIRRHDNRMGLLVLCGALVVVLLLTFSRGGWIAAMISAGILFLFWIHRTGEWRLWLRPRRLIPLILVASLLLGIAIFVVVQRGEDFFSGKRQNLMVIAAEMAGERPLTGFGVSQYGKHYWERHDTDIPNLSSPTAHNVLLNTAAETGLPGLLILLWLVGVYLMVWRSAWLAATPGRRIRLEGILAALAGFAVYSMVDTFITTSAVFPVALFVAYTLAGHYTPHNQAPAPEKVPLWRDMRIPALILLVAYAGWFSLVTNPAEDHYIESVRAVGSDNLEQALEQSEEAQEIDPEFGLYDIQHAYVLGLLAEDEPANYLARAIEAHQQALDNHPAYHLGHANLAALHGQQMDFAAAIDAAQQALQYNPDSRHYLAMLAIYQETAGRDETALATYRALLDESPGLAQSYFWLEGPPDGVRRRAFEIFYQNEADLAEKLLIDIALEDAQAASEHYQQLLAKEKLEGEELVAVARYAEYQNDDAAAIEWYDRALDEGMSRALEARTYLDRGWVYFELGDLEAAEENAEDALFEHSEVAYRANYLLALIEIERDNPPLDDPRINRLLARAFPERPSFVAYISNVFSRPSAFTLLPQAPIIRPTSYAELYEPHLLLAQRFDEDGDPETDPAGVYRLVPRELRPAAYR
jgi:O-antigen ligase